MNTSILVNSLLNKAGLGTVSVDSLLSPVKDKAKELRQLQEACYAEGDTISAQIEKLLTRKTELTNEAQRAGRIAAQLDVLVL